MPTEVDNEKFVDLVIYAWVCWTGRGALNLRAAQSGNVMGTISTPEEARYELPLTEEQFLLVDLRYAQLSNAHSRVVDRVYHKGGYSDRQLKKMGLTRYLWDKRVTEARLAMYEILKPQIEGWRP